MKANNYLEYILRCEKELSKAFAIVGKHHVAEPDVHSMCKLFSSWCDEHIGQIEKQVERYGKEDEKEPERLGSSILRMHSGSLGLLRDLHDLALMITEIKLSWIVLLQCSKAIRDSELKIVCVK